jgi:hypothetical protein
MPGGIMDFQLPRQPKRFRRRERLIQRGQGVRVRIVHDQYHFVRLRIVFGHDRFYFPPNGSTNINTLHVPLRTYSPDFSPRLPACYAVPSSVPVPAFPPGTAPLLIHANNRPSFVIRTVVYFKHILHIGYKRRILLRRYTPAFLQMWFQGRFF